MINFGDKLGRRICVDNLIYTSSYDTVLVLDTNMKVVQRIKAQAEILEMGIHNDLYVMTVDSILIFTIDGKLTKKYNIASQITHPFFYRGVFYFYAADRNQFCKFTTKIENILPFEQNDQNTINCIQVCSRSIYFSCGNRILEIYEDEIFEVKKMNRPFKNFICYNDQLACSDDQGRLIIIQLDQHQGKVIFQDQWHAHEINCLIYNGDSLYTAGKEGVVVHWHLSVARKAFFPRQGGEIISLSISNNQDVLFVNIKDKNELRQISLMGQNVLPSYQGVQSNTFHQVFRQHNNALMTNATPGQLQFIIPDKNVIGIVDVCHKNYISDIDSDCQRDITDIKDFIFIEQYLICLVQSSVQNSIHFLVNTDLNNYTALSIAACPTRLNGISSSSSELLVASWGEDSIRLWAYVMNKKGIKQWNCVFHGDHYKSQIQSVGFVGLNVVIIFKNSYLIIDRSNTIISERTIQFDQFLLFQSNLYLIYKGKFIIHDLQNRKYSTIDIKLKIAHSINQINNNLLYIQADNQVLTFNIKLKKFTKIVANSNPTIIPCIINNIASLVNYDRHSNNYQCFLQFETERKASFIQEMEIEPEILPQEGQLILDNEVKIDHKSQLKRYTIAQQLRQMYVYLLKQQIPKFD